MMEDISKGVEKTVGSDALAALKAAQLTSTK